MSPKILRRCSNCGNFHASYLVPDLPEGKNYYCTRCWNAYTAAKLKKPAVEDRQESVPPKDTPPRSEEHNP